MPLSKSAILRSLLVAFALALVGAPGAEAASSTSTSTNWSGYVAHGHSARFRSVYARWTQPTATCTPHNASYSAIWVGLGGYDLNSQALEQIGTEVDCTASGGVISTAWYELVPAPSTGIRMTVRPGDVMAGRVSVVGHRVTLSLIDRTLHKSFIKTVNDSSIDVTSADWIVEAPSQCNGNGTNCQALPLADFGTETFVRAAAQTTRRQTGTVSSRWWDTNAITLVPGGTGPQYTGFISGTQGESSPSALLESGTSFTLTYSAVTPPPVGTAASAAARRAASRSLSSGSRLQPGGVRR